MSNQYKQATKNKILAFICWALIDIGAKALSNSQSPISIHQIALIQYSISALIMGYWLYKQKRKLPPPIQIHLHFWRIITSGLAIICLYHSFTQMALAKALSVSFISPIITLCIAKFVFREEFTLTRIIALWLGITGFITISNNHTSIGLPQISLHQLQLMWYPTCATLLFSLTTMLTKMLVDAGEKPEYCAITLILALPIIFLPSGLAYWHHTPTITQIGILAIMGLMSTYAIILFIKAVSQAQLNYLLPLGFIKYCITCFIAALILHEIPSPRTLLGVVLILTGSSILYFGENNKKNRRKKNILPRSLPITPK